MITALSTPASGRVMLDANDTIIKLQSTNGEGFYFRAFIYIDNILFDEQGWSRVDAYTATKNLKKLYNAYFSPVFRSSFLGTIEEQIHLKKEVKIVIEEHSLDAGKVDEITLPVFYFLYNVKSERFTDVNKVKILDVPVEVMVLPKDGKIALPFYANAAGENINVEVTTNTGTVLNTRTVGVKTGKFIYLYKLNLSPLGISRNVLYLTAKISVGTAFVTKIYRINHLPDFPTKEIVFRNNYGFYIYAYLDGELEVNNAYDQIDYDTGNGEKILQIDETATYSINSGSLRQNEKEILTMIANSIDVKFNGGWQGSANNGLAFVSKFSSDWFDLKNANKKQLGYRDKTHNYSETLQFTLRKANNIENIGMIQMVGNVPDLEITGHSISGNKVTIVFKTNNDYTAPDYKINFKKEGTTAWATAVVPGPPGPVTLKLAPGTYTIRMQAYENNNNVSNSIIVTL